MHVLLIRAHRTHIHFCGRQRSSRTNAEYVAQSYNLFRVLTAQRAGRQQHHQQPVHYIISCASAMMSIYLLLLLFFIVYTPYKDLTHVNAKLNNGTICHTTSYTMTTTNHADRAHRVESFNYNKSSSSSSSPRIRLR